MGKKVTITVTPVSGGKPKPKEVDVAKTGSSVAEALKTAGIKLDKGMQILVDGEPGDERTHVAPGAKIDIAEKVRGS